MKLDAISRMAPVPFFHILIYEMEAIALIFTFDHMIPWTKENGTNGNGVIVPILKWRIKPILFYKVCHRILWNNRGWNLCIVLIPM